MEHVNSQAEIQRLSEIAMAGILSQHYNEVSVSETADNFVFSIPKDFFKLSMIETKQTDIPKKPLTRMDKIFGFMNEEKDIPEDFDDMCADEIEQLFAGEK